MRAAWVRVIPAFGRGVFLLALLSACAGRISDIPESQDPLIQPRPSRAMVEILRGVVGRDVLALVGMRPIILASTYDYLYRTGIERSDYGLYSYVLFPAHSSRAERFLEELFKTTSYTATSLIGVENLNVIYLLTRANQLHSLKSMISAESAPSGRSFATQIYDYDLAQKLLAQICVVPAEVIRDLCATDLSHGPYLFTYARPASTLSPVPPPYLFLDLSAVHMHAFAEFIAAYKA